MLRRFPLGSTLLTIGGVLTVIGFIAYFNESATLNLVGFFYGIPVLLGGLALRAAELKPVEFSQPTPEHVLKLRDTQATPTQNQVRKDVTRFRYGQTAHLDEAMKRLGLSPNDDQRPVLDGLRETAVDGCYALVLEFNSPFLTLDQWQNKAGKMERFFGPNLRVEVLQPAENRIDVALIAQAATPVTPVG